MAWSKVKPGKKPLGWWYHKLLCELGWSLRDMLGSESMYYKHLRVLCDRYGYNLYGEPKSKRANDDRVDFFYSPTEDINYQNVFWASLYENRKRRTYFKGLLYTRCQRAGQPLESPYIDSMYLGTGTHSDISFGEYYRPINTFWDA